MNMFRQTWDGRLDRQYLRVCATFKLLKLCKIDAARAVELLAERRIHNAENVVGNWVNTLQRNEWSEGAFGQRTVLGQAYVGPRP
ncbi:hypothetical protein OIU34_23275 [Pararhizobium sp. BT-229]|uniref:hypothetical protein n=1 Tax=Pararhizobium sp. BT-229 TaxID=2986923 RepID=UPI0021F7C03C|nr:hypothetical protein [Pararhizobium sp. BT-229]MCV9964818.1 hypothetical protein [Pararhizobium sp. BT-229]